MKLTPPAELQMRNPLLFLTFIMGMVGVELDVYGQSAFHRSAWLENRQSAHNVADHVVQVSDIAPPGSTMRSVQAVAPDIRVRALSVIPLTPQAIHVSESNLNSAEPLNPVSPSAQSVPAEKTSAVLATTPTTPTSQSEASPQVKERSDVEWVELKRSDKLTRPFAKASSDSKQEQAETPIYASHAVRVSPLNKSEVLMHRQWDIRFRDVTVRRMLLRWSREAQYQLIWEAARDFPVDVEAVLQGDFRDAVASVMESLSVTDYPVQALINSNLRQIRVIRYLQGQAR